MMRANNVSSSSNHTIYAPSLLETAKHSTDEKALLDSGASHNFIDIQTIIRLGIGTKRLNKPRLVTNIDGTINKSGKIFKYINLNFSYQDWNATLPFYVTDLGRDRIIFGIPWFQEFEPTISWKNGTIDGTILARTTTKIAEINKTTLASEWAITAKGNKTWLKEDDIPIQYQDYADVFSEEKATQFPPTREEDHKIKFTEDVPRFFKSNVYSMTTSKVAFLRKWLDDKLMKGFICPSKLPYPSPMFSSKRKTTIIE
jgi:hypothetical protein